MRLKLTPFGADYSPEKFLRTPSQTISGQMKMAENETQRHINSTSISASYVAHYLIQIAHSYSGSKKAPPKTEPKDFLPFPDWESAWNLQETHNRPTEITRAILKTLLIKRRLPIHVYIALDGKAEKQALN